MQRPPHKVQGYRPTRTIQKPKKLIQPTVEALVPDLPSQLLQSTQPEFTELEWESYRADVAEANYKRMLDHREKIVNNIEKFIEQYQYMKYNLRKAVDLMKKKDATIEKLTKKKDKYKDLCEQLEAEAMPPPPKKNPAWIDRPIVIYLDDGEEGEKADRELELEMQKINKIK